MNAIQFTIIQSDTILLLHDEHRELQKKKPLPNDKFAERVKQYS